MISLPRGVADYLAPHPDVEIVRLRSSSYGATPRLRGAKLNRPGGARAPGRCCFLSLTGQRAAAVVGACDEHETDNREPRDHEGSDHIVVLSVFRALLRRASAVQRARSPNGACAKLVLAERKWLVSGFCAGPADLLARSNPPTLAKELVVGLGDAPSIACMSGR